MKQTTNRSQVINKGICIYLVGGCPQQNRPTPSLSPRDRRRLWYQLVELGPTRTAGPSVKAERKLIKISNPDAAGESLPDYVLSHQQSSLWSHVQAVRYLPNPGTRCTPSHRFRISGLSAISRNHRRNSWCDLWKTVPVVSDFCAWHAIPGRPPRCMARAVRTHKPLRPAKSHETRFAIRLRAKSVFEHQLHPRVILCTRFGSHASSILKPELSAYPFVNKPFEIF